MILLASSRVAHEFFFFQRLVGWALLVWGLGNVAIGTATQLSKNPFFRQFGLQSLVWGAINGGIALFSLRGAQAKFALHSDPRSEAGRFRVIVAVNAALDVGYIAGGLAALHGARGKPQRAGLGLGIIIQGLFLLLFDLVLVALSGRYTKR